MHTNVCVCEVCLRAVTRLGAEHRGFHVLTNREEAISGKLCEEQGFSNCTPALLENREDNAQTQAQTKGWSPARNLSPA